MIEGSGSVPLPNGSGSGSREAEPDPEDPQHCKKTHLLLAGVGHEVEQGHVLVAAGLGVGDAREAVELEAEGVAALTAVHVVPEREDDLQHLAQSLAALHLLARLQHPRHLDQCFFKNMKTLRYITRNSGLNYKKPGSPEFW
jgi:hypothetical protein